jgi:transposase InsO family protein
MEDGFDYRKHHDLKETFDMTVEQASMPFYSTEPGSRDFVIDANTYLTHKMGAGTRHMLGRVFARRELMALYRALEEADPTFQSADAEFREAAEHYQRASTEALGWRHALAQEKARLGLEAMDRWFTAHGEPDRLHTDWDADVTFTPVKQGFASGAAGLEQELKRLSGK